MKEDIIKKRTVGRKPEEILWERTGTGNHIYKGSKGEIYLFEPKNSDCICNIGKKWEA